MARVVPVLPVPDLSAAKAVGAARAMPSPGVQTSHVAARPTSYRSNCGVCGESYDDENLMSCTRCGRDFCYRCGDWGSRLCARCLETDAGPQESPPETNDAAGHLFHS